MQSEINQTESLVSNGNLQSNINFYTGVANCWKYGKGFGFSRIKHLVCGSLLAIYAKYDEPHG